MKLLLFVAAFVSAAIASEVPEEAKIVRGKLLFSPTGTYEEIPPESCIQITVREDIHCMNCEIEVIGERVIKDIKIVNNELHYEIEFKKRDSNLYTISAVFNVGWCGKNTDEYIRRGDYHTDSARNLKFSHDEPLKENINIPMAHHKIESFQDIAVKGSVLLPAKGVYTHFPKGSCLRVQIGHVCPDDSTHCKLGVIAETEMTSLFVLDDSKHIDYQIHVPKHKLPAAQYMMTAYLSVGWCNREKSYKTSAQPGDYYSEKHVSFVRKETDDEILGQTIPLVAHQKYMCGKEQCFVTETCNVTKQGDVTCRCPPFACGDLAEPEWVCGTDGKNYVSECWMGAADCFSKTITVASIGKCGSTSVGEFWIKDKTYVIGFGSAVAVILLFLVLVLAACFLRRGNRSVQIVAAPQVPYGKLDGTKQPYKEEHAEDGKYYFQPVAFIHERVENPYVDTASKTDAMLNDWKADMLKKSQV